MTRKKRKNVLAREVRKIMKQELGVRISLPEAKMVVQEIISPGQIFNRSCSTKLYGLLYDITPAACGCCWDYKLNSTGRKIRTLAREIGLVE